MALLRTLARMMPKLTAEEQLLHVAAATSGNSATIPIEDVRRQARDLECIASGGSRRTHRRARAGAAKQSAETLAAMGIGVVMAEA